VTPTLAHALMHENLGTDYCQCTQVTMLFFGPVPIGIMEKQRGRDTAGVDRELDVSTGLAVVTAEPTAPRVIDDYDFVYCHEDHRFVYPDEAGLARRA
jgi:hypothetical protein